MTETIECDTVLSLVREFYKLSGKVSNLGSCQDINFKFKDEITSKSYVVKFTPVTQSTTLEIDLQHCLIKYLSTRIEMEGVDLPIPIPKNTDAINTCNHEYISEVDISGIQYYMRMLTFVQGNILSDYKYYNPEVLLSFGEFVGNITLCLKDFENYMHDRPEILAVANRDLEW